MTEPASVPSAAAGDAAAEAPPVSRFSRYVGYVSTAFGYASAVLILASVLVISYAACLRYFFGASTVWQTELTIYFLLFATFCGAAYGLKHDEHVRIDLLVDQVGPRARRVLRFAAALLSLLLVVLIAVYSFDEWLNTVSQGRRSGTAWNPSLVLPHLIVPVGMTLLALQYLAIIVDMITQSSARGQNTSEST